MRRSWAGSLLLLALLGCGRGEEQKPPPPLAGPVQQVLESWMGRYSRRDEALRVLLSSQEGWGRLRDMELRDAAALFAGGNADTDRLGLARTHLEFADAFECLQEAFLEAEVAFGESPGGAPPAPARARAGLARLLSGQLGEARETFASQPPPGLAACWDVGRAGLAAAEGRQPEAAQLLRRAAGTGGEEGRGLARLAAFAWHTAIPPGGTHPLERAAVALEHGDDPAPILLALQRAFSWTPSSAPAPDLFAYLLLQRAHARQALLALGEPKTIEAAFLAGRALEHLGEVSAAASMYARARGAPGSSDAAWIFSPLLGPEEAARLAWVRRGELLGARAREGEREALWGQALAGDGGASPLVAAAVAAAQSRTGGTKPFANPAAAAEEALARAAGLAAQLPTGERDSLLSALYPARVAAVARWAAATHLTAGQPRKALDLLEQAHRKASGYRPDFVNRPAFIVDLARTYAAAGEYAPAVAALFEMSRRYPESRLAYEGLKRLYAARVGGGAQPRY